MTTRKRNLILISVAFLLFSLSFAFLPREYIVGGDDSGLYYIFPEKFLSGTFFHLISNTVPGGIGDYFPRFFLLPLYSTIYLLKVATFGLINIQKLLLSLNIACSFYFFALFIEQLKKVLDDDHEVASLASVIVSSIVYTFSSALFWGVWQHLIYVVFLQAVAPLLLLLWLSYLRYKKVVYLLAISLFAALNIHLVIAFPYLYGLIIGMIPLLIIVFIKYPKKVVISMTVLLILFLSTNSYILTHFLIQNRLEKTSALNTVSGLNSDMHKKAIHSDVDYYSRFTSTFSTLTNQPQSGIFGDSISYNKVKYLWIGNGVFLFFTLLGQFRRRRCQLSMITAMICFILCSIIFMVSFRPYGKEVFIFLTDNLPFFTGLRNSLDKLSIAYSLSFALLVGMGVDAFLRSINNKLLKITFILIFFSFALVCAYPLLGGALYTSPRYAGTNFRLINKLNTDYLDLVKYIQYNLPQDGSRVIWFPLNHGGYATIQDEDNPLFYYAGLSPTLLFTGRNDYVGSLGLPTEVSSKLFESMTQNDWISAGKILRDLNVRYIVDDRGITDSMMQSWYFNQNEVRSQKQFGQIVGKKMTTIGNRYVLYKISDLFNSDKISVMDLNGMTSFSYVIGPDENFFVQTLVGTNNLIVQLKDASSSLWFVKPVNQSLYSSLRKPLFQWTPRNSYTNEWSGQYVSIARYCDVEGYADGSCILSNNKLKLSLEILFIPNLVKWPLIYLAMVLFILQVVVSITLILRNNRLLLSVISRLTRKY